MTASTFDLSFTREVGAELDEARFDQRSYNVLDYGATPEGVLLASPGIQRALDACSAGGGGTVIIPRGRFCVGSLFIGSNTRLLFEEGAILLASLELRDYPECPTRFIAVEMTMPMGILNVVDSQNVLICGPGVMEGRGKPFWEKFRYYIRDYEEAGLRWAADYDARNPRSLVIQNCRNVAVCDLTFRNSPFWTVQILYSSKVTASGLTIRNNEDGHGPSSDGINVDSSSYVLVEDNDIDCNDDNLCLKAGRDADGLRVNRPTEYVVIRNNHTRKGAGLVTFGSDTSGWIRHVHVDNITSEGTTRGVRFKSALTRGGGVSDVLVENIEIHECPFLFEFLLNWNPAFSYCELPPHISEDQIPGYWKPLLQRVEPPERGIPEVSDVFLRNMSNSGKCWKAFVVEGPEAKPIQNLHFENVRIHTQTAGHIHQARDWTFRDCEFRFDDGAMPELRNVENLPAFTEP